MTTPAAAVFPGDSEMSRRCRAHRWAATPLGAERERLRALVLQMPVPVALTEGPEHRFALVNDAFRRISGGGHDVTGRTVRAARSPKSRGRASTSGSTGRTPPARRGPGPRRSSASTATGSASRTRGSTCGSSRCAPPTAG